MTHTEPIAEPIGLSEQVQREAAGAGETTILPPRGVVVLLSTLLVLTICGGVWILLATRQLTSALAIICSGAAVVLATVGTFRLCHFHWTGRFEEQVAEREKQQSRMRARLFEFSHREEQSNLERAELQKKVADLLQSNKTLSDELNRRKEAERTMTLQRQDLARSRGVLELHVQASVEELQKLQRRHELILNSADEGICGVDVEGKIAFANPTAAKILGTSIENMIGRPVMELFRGVPAGNKPGVHATKDGHYSEILLNRLDGSSFVVEYSRSPIREDRRIVGEVLLFKDITERKQSEEALALKATELARSNSELEQFAFVASHDLQEPLRKILAFGDRLKVKCSTMDLGEGQEYLERMQNAAARMRTLIDDLLTFSRVISRTEPFVPVDLNTVVREVLGDLEVRVERTGATVNVGKLPTIEADATQMRQLLQNLIGNALKFHEPNAKPVVNVESRIVSRTRGPTETSLLRMRASGEKMPDEQICELSVRDNGIGFDEKYLDRIFSIFQRLHGRQEYEGTGIGLAVCRRIVDRHGGTLTAKSSPGSGATFIALLPLRQPEKAAQST
jgi:PAS domain S-box-containing protein